MTNYPKTVSELYPSKWLKAADLTKPVTVTIQSTKFETVYDSRGKQHVLKLVVSFKGCQKRLIPNKTQCEAIWAITNSEHFADWPGHSVILSPGQAHNGKPTIAISRPAGPRPSSPPMPQTQAIEAAQSIQDQIEFNRTADHQSFTKMIDTYYSQE